MSEEAKIILKDMQIEEMRKELINQDKYISKLKEEYANKLQQKENIIKEVKEYIEENQEEHKYTDRGGFTYTEGHFLRDSETLLEILDDEKV